MSWLLQSGQDSVGRLGYSSPPQTQFLARPMWATYWALRAWGAVYIVMLCLPLQLDSLLFGDGPHPCTSAPFSHN